MNSIASSLRSLLALLCLWQGSVLAAQDSVQAAQGCGPDESRCVPVGTWEIQLAVGLGARSNPLLNGDEIPLVLVPQVNYYGKRFFLDNLDLGYTLVDRRDFMLNALVTPGTDGLFFFQKGWRNVFIDGGLRTTGSSFVPGPVGDNSDGAPMPNNGQQEPGSDPEENPDEGPTPEVRHSASLDDLHKRRIAAMAGLEMSSNLGPIEWQLQALTDVTGIHDGEELRFALSSGQQYREHKVGLALGLSWKSAALLEYYYGVRADEASEALPAYEPGSGTTPFVRLSWSKPINRDWRWMASVQYEHLSRAVRDSPIVTDNQVMQVFIGGVYHF